MRGRGGGQLYSGKSGRKVEKRDNILETMKEDIVIGNSRKGITLA